MLATGPGVQSLRHNLNGTNLIGATMGQRTHPVQLADW
jgi:hypothetical protein